jgi:hypothetical protein
MEHQHQHENKSIKQNNLSDPKEVERLLMMYSGVFKRNIKEYSERVIKKNQVQKNWSL